MSWMSAWAAFRLVPQPNCDFKVIEPNDYTSFRIARTASDIVIVAELSNSGANQSTPLNDMPPDGIVVRGPFRDAGNLGYAITCWRGEG